MPHACIVESHADYVSSSWWQTSYSSGSCAFSCACTYSWQTCGCFIMLFHCSIRLDGSGCHCPPLRKATMSLMTTSIGKEMILGLSMMLPLKSLMSSESYLPSRSQLSHRIYKHANLACLQPFNNFSKTSLFCQSSFPSIMDSWLLLILGPLTTWSLTNHASSVTH
jgi:hypothetical protein